MKKSFLIILSLGAILLSNPYSFASESQNGAALENNERNSALGQIDDFAQEFKPKQPDKDPFMTLVTPPAPVIPAGPVKVDDDKKIKHEPQRPPLPLKVTFIVGSSYRKFANLSLNGRFYQMTSGEYEENRLFKVIEVQDRYVIIWDFTVDKERKLMLYE